MASVIESLAADPNHPILQRLYAEHPEARGRLEAPVRPARPLRVVCVRARARVCVRGDVSVRNASPVARGPSPTAFRPPMPAACPRARAWCSTSYRSTWRAPRARALQLTHACSLRSWTWCSRGAAGSLCASPTRAKARRASCCWAEAACAGPGTAAAGVCVCVYVFAGRRGGFALDAMVVGCRHRHHHWLIAWRGGVAFKHWFGAR